MHLPWTHWNNIYLTNITSNCTVLKQMHVIILTLFFSPLLSPIKPLHLYNKYLPRTNQNYFHLQLPHVKPSALVQPTNSLGSCLILDPQRLLFTILHHQKSFNALWFSPLQFQSLGGKKISNQTIQLSNITLPEFNSNITIDSQVAYLFDKKSQYNIIFGADHDKFGFTINYNENILKSIDHKISRNNPDEFFKTNMFIDLNDNYAKIKKTTCFNRQLQDAKYKQANNSKVATYKKHFKPKPIP